LFEEVLRVAFDATGAVVHAAAIRPHIVEEPTELTRNVAGLYQFLAETCLYSTVRLGIESACVQCDLSGVEAGGVETVLLGVAFDVRVVGPDGEREATVVVEVDGG